MVVRNVLFVCSRNQWRSPTAEKIYARDERINVRSAGTSPRAKRTISIHDIHWADIIFVMEHKHKERIKATFRHAVQHKRMIVLDIPDEYPYMDEELIMLLKQSVEAYIS